MPSTFTVTNTLDDGSAGSLRWAINQVNSDANDSTAQPDLIAFAPGLSGTITLTSGELLVNQPVTINGPGASELAVSGNNASRVFEFASGVTAAISGLTIENGNGTPAPSPSATRAAASSISAR